METRYRLLNPGEVIAEGDEYWNANYQWIPAGKYAGEQWPESWSPFRRPLPPCQCEELRKQIKRLKARLGGHISEEEHNAIINEINPLGQEF